MTTRKTSKPRTAKRTPRRQGKAAAEKRDRLIEKLLSADELGHVGGGYARCNPQDCEEI